MIVAHLERAPRRFWRDRTELLIGVASVTALTVGAAVSTLTHQPVLVGLFRQVTGVPCPLCGGTRAAQSLAAGQPMEAMLWNPLATALVVAAGAWLILRVACGRRVRVVLTPRGRAAAWGVVVAAVLTNWAYVVAVRSPL